MTVQPQDVPRVLGAVGNVKASASVGLTPRVTGEIEKVHFTEGQDVKEGDVLLTIDTRPFEATLREKKKGQLAKSEAQLHKATNDAGRYGKLVGNGYVSREAYEQTATEAAALRATVQADKAAVESAALDLSYCTLRAPISGRVGGLKVDKGQYGAQLRYHPHRQHRHPFAHLCDLFGAGAASFPDPRPHACRTCGSGRDPPRAGRPKRAC